MGKAALVSSHDQAIRSNLLNRLGIYKNASLRGNSDPPRYKQAPIRHGHHSSPTKSGSQSIIGKNAVPFLEPLKDDASSQRSSFRVSRKSGRIHFNQEVSVMPIPSHHDYSSRIKKFLWSNGEEIQENAERNRIEFASEGWDWHTVLEDDDMYVDANTGELVHPCWFDDGILDTDEGEEYLDVAAPGLSRSESVTIGLEELRE